MHSKRKKLIVSGCSFTTSKYKSSAYPDMKCDWHKWPELLAEKLDMDLINLAFSGMGNRGILLTLLEAIERTPKDEIGYVMAAWSQSNRDDYWIYKDFDYQFTMEHFLKGFKWENTRKSRPGDVFSWVRETILGYITLQNVCKRYNIPYKQFQMLDLFSGWVSGLVRTEGEIQSILRGETDGDPYARDKYPGNDPNGDKKRLRKLLLEYEKFIDLDNFIGWPTVRHLGGYSIEMKCTMRELWHKNLFKGFEILPDRVIGGIDKHPNENGHTKIMRHIYEQLG